MATAIKLGQECADAITEKLFIHPIELEFEQVYLPLLLMNKKRYAKNSTKVAGKDRRFTLYLR